MAMSGTNKLHFEVMQLQDCVQKTWVSQTMCWLIQMCEHVYSASQAVTIIRFLSSNVTTGIIPPPTSYLLCQHACIKSMHYSCIASMCMWLCVPYSTKVWCWQIIKVLHFMDLTVNGRIHQFIKVNLLFNLFGHSSQICQRFSLSNSALY